MNETSQTPYEVVAVYGDLIPFGGRGVSVDQSRSWDNYTRGAISEWLQEMFPGRFTQRLWLHNGSVFAEALAGNDPESDEFATETPIGSIIHKEILQVKVDVLELPHEVSWMFTLFNDSRGAL